MFSLTAASTVVNAVETIRGIQARARLTVAARHHADLPMDVHRALEAGEAARQALDDVLEALVDLDAAAAFAIVNAVERGLAGAR